MPTRIDFDEDIILIQTSFIKHLETLPKTALKLLPDLPKYLKKNKGLGLDLYELLNMYIIYGNGILELNPDYNAVLLKLFTASFDKRCDLDKSAFLGSSLMQIWIQVSHILNSLELQQFISRYSQKYPLFGFSSNKRIFGYCS